MLRPNQVVLDENAIIPVRNIVNPAPNQFTHELLQQENYYFENPKEEKQPDGILKKGTKILIVNNAEKFCWVISEDGLYVSIASGNLAAL